MNHISRLTAAVLMLSAALAQAQSSPLGRNLAATCANCHGTNGAARGIVRFAGGSHVNLDDFGATKVVKEFLAERFP